MSGGYIIQNNYALTQRVIVLEANEIFNIKTSISFAQISTGNTVPVQILAAPGVGKTYQPFLILLKYNFVTAAFATNVNMRILFTGATQTLAQNNLILGATSNRIQVMAIMASGSSNSQYLENTEMVWQIQTGNPTAGGGSLDIYTSYRTLTL